MNKRKEGKRARDNSKSEQEITASTKEEDMNMVTKNILTEIETR